MTSARRGRMVSGVSRAASNVYVRLAMRTNRFKQVDTAEEAAAMLGQSDRRSRLA